MSKHKPTMTIHAVPWGSGGNQAECGERIDGREHTGHYRPLSASQPGWHVCAACAGAR